LRIPSNHSSFPINQTAFRVCAIIPAEARYNLESPSTGGGPQKGQPRGKRALLPIVGLPAPSDEERILVDSNIHREILAPPQLEAVAGAKAVSLRVINRPVLFAFLECIGLSKSHSRAATVFVDELDAGRLQTAAHCQVFGQTPSEVLLREGREER
jgi:hypothetical protein